MEIALNHVIKALSQEDSMGLQKVIARINELFSSVNFHTMTVEDEHAMLRMAAQQFKDAYNKGEIFDTPAFYLDTNDIGRMIVVVEGNPQGGHA